MARLYKFSVSEEWDCLFGGVRQIILPRPTSDHFPIYLRGGGGGGGGGGVRVCPKAPLLLDSRTCGLRRMTSKT